MKTNHYESVVILSASLEDAQIDSTLNRIEDQISSEGGNILNIDKWGRRRLAYPIKKSKSGFYTVYQFEAPRELISKLERTFRLDENIFRYLTIKLEKRDLENIEQLRIQSEAAEEVKAVEENETVKDESVDNNE